MGEIGELSFNGSVINETTYVKARSGFGVGVANIGDLNEDGTTDYAVGALAGNILLFLLFIDSLL